MTYTFLPPAPTTPPVEGPQLDALFQALVVGVTGLSGDLVRPRWQPTEPKQPERDTDWCAIGVASITPDDGPALGAYPDPNAPSSTLIRHEAIEVQASFYGPNGQRLAAILRDGLSIPQNIQILLDNDAAFVSSGAIVSAPELINQLWFKRYDVTLQFRRKVSRIFQILTLTSATFGLKSTTPGLFP